MNLLRTLIASAALVVGVAAVPGVASAQERGPDGAPAQMQFGRDGEHRDGDRDRDFDRDRGDRDRGGWDRDRRDWDRERAEREAREHERACRVAYERGAPPWELAFMGCWR